MYRISIIVTICFGIIAACVTLSPTKHVEECTGTWIICGDESSIQEQIEKLERDHYILILTSENKIEKLHIDNFEIKFQDVDVPRIEKTEIYKIYSGILKEKKKTIFYIILPEEYKSNLFLWCEK